jgi:hypothetical protein
MSADRAKDKTEMENRQLGYSEPEDFCLLFRKHMAALYQLAFLLVSDHKRAASVFLTDLDECLNGNAVLRRSARSSTRRAVIISAIREIAPTPSRTRDAFAINDKWCTQSQSHELSLGIRRLSPFLCFVFVLSVLEGFGDVECAVLLGCTQGDVAQARILAFQSITPPDEMPTAACGFAGASQSVRTFQ